MPSIDTETRYVIVKHAGDTHPHHWEKDPKETGVCICHSVFDTHTGKQHNIRKSYQHKGYADSDCIVLNYANPSGDYAVCTLIEEAVNA